MIWSNLHYNNLAPKISLVKKDLKNLIKKSNLDICCFKFLYLVSTFF
jgi:tRNA1(Val) A37 N6-methylase TrmN6